MMDIAVKESQQSPAHPDLTDIAGWTKLAASVTKAVANANLKEIAPAAVLIAAYNRAGGTLSGLRAELEALPSPSTRG